MNTHTFDLLFLKTKPGHLPHPPIAHIYVKGASRIDYDGKGEGKIFLGADCMSPRELADQVDQLKRDLDKIKEEGAKRYAAARSD